MTDERIEVVYDEYNKTQGYESFASIIKTAERLAKIEVLETMKKELDAAGKGCYFSSENMQGIIDKLKDGK